MGTQTINWATGEELKTAIDTLRNKGFTEIQVVRTSAFPAPGAITACYLIIYGQWKIS